MALSQSDFLNWRQDPVTKAFFLACQERIEEAKETLAASAGNDPLFDKTLVGLIRAYHEVQEFRIDELEGQE